MSRVLRVIIFTYLRYSLLCFETHPFVSFRSFWSSMSWFICCNHFSIDLVIFIKEVIWLSGTNSKCWVRLFINYALIVDLFKILEMLGLRNDVTLLKTVLLWLWEVSVVNFRGDRDWGLLICGICSQSARFGLLGSGEFTGCWCLPFFGYSWAWHERLHSARWFYSLWSIKRIDRCCSFWCHASWTWVCSYNPWIFTRWWRNNA